MPVEMVALFAVAAVMIAGVMMIVGVTIARLCIAEMYKLRRRERAEINRMRQRYLRQNKAFVEATRRGYPNSTNRPSRLASTKSVMRRRHPPNGYSSPQ